MACLPAAVLYGNVSLAYAVLPALLFWLILNMQPPVSVKSSLLIALIPAGALVLMHATAHLGIYGLSLSLMGKRLSALTLAYRAGDVASVVLALIVISAVSGCISTRFIHQKEFAVRRCDLRVQDLCLPGFMLAFSLLVSTVIISPIAFDDATMIMATPALAMLLAWSFEALVLEPRAQLPGPPTPETRSQRYGLVAIAALALLVVYGRGLI